MQDQEQEEIKKLKKKLKKQEQKNREVRDQMALQRTIFANERTLMAYLRTAIAVIGGGIAAIKLSKHLYIEVLGIVLVPAGLLLAMYSFYRYLHKKKLIKRQREEYSHPHTASPEKQASGYGNED